MGECSFFFFIASFFFSLSECKVRKFTETTKCAITVKICSRGNKECLGKNIYIFVVFFFFNDVCMWLNK